MKLKKIMMKMDQRQDCIKNESRKNNITIHGLSIVHKRQKGGG